MRLFRRSPQPTLDLRKVERLLEAELDLLKDIRRCLVDRPVPHVKVDGPLTQQQAAAIKTALRHEYRFKGVSS